MLKMIGEGLLGLFVLLFVLCYLIRQVMLAILFDPRNPSSLRPDTGHKRATFRGRDWYRF